MQTHNRTLYTKRLRLREITSADVFIVQRIFQDEGAMRFAEPRDTSVEALRLWITTAHTLYETHGYGPLLMEHSTLDTPVGIVAINRHEGFEPEIGYRVIGACQGCGYATEAVIQMVEYALVDRGIPKVIALIDHENTASQRVAEKSGMTREDLVTFKGRQVWRYGIEDS